MEYAIEYYGSYICYAILYYTGHSPLARCLLAGSTDGVQLLLIHQADTTAINIHGLYL